MDQHVRNLYMIWNSRLHLYHLFKSSVSVPLPAMDSRLTLLLSLLFSSFPFSTLSTRCNPNDYNALIKIKISFNLNWDPNTDCCDWYSLQCDTTTNRVTELCISSSNISGQIADSIGDLPYLTKIRIRKLTNLTGSIPRSITNLKNLQFLDLTWNKLSGPVPNFLNQLHNLIFLELSFNQFTGSIPPNLSQLTKLVSLRLDRNKLSGSIPDSFGRFTDSFNDLYLSHNQLTGSIPKSLGDLKFQSIDLSRNMLVGDGSMLFNPNASTNIIDVSRNLLEFDFSKVRFPKSLNVIDINHNKVFGRIPEEITELKSLQSFNVSYNRLCGEIPIGGKLQSFDNSSFFHNRCLCGLPLPTCK